MHFLAFLFRYTSISIRRSVFFLFFFIYKKKQRQQQHFRSNNFSLLFLRTIYVRSIYRGRSILFPEEGNSENESFIRPLKEYRSNSFISIFCQEAKNIFLVFSFKSIFIIFNMIHTHHYLLSLYILLANKISRMPGSGR